MKYDPGFTQQRFIENVQLVIAEKRLLQKEVCMEAGISVKTLYLYTMGASIPMDKADSIAHALGYTLVGLINWRQK